MIGTHIYWVKYRRGIKTEDFSPYIEFTEININKPTGLKYTNNLAGDMPEAVAMVVLPQLIKDKLELHTSKISLEAIEHINKYNNVADIFRDFVWPAIENNLKNTIEGKKAAVKTDHLYTIIEQTSGSMSMRAPELKYLGPYFDKMWKVVTDWMEDFKKNCKHADGKHYYRPDGDFEDLFDTWEDVMEDLLGTLAEDGKLIIDLQEWEPDADPGFLCIYAKEIGNE